MIPILSGQDHVERLIAGGQPAWILKHSATCPTSAAALAEVESYLAAHPDEPVGMVVVQQDRPLSNWIATRLGRVHQSPQLFLLRGGVLVWSVSHWSITATAMATERARLG